MTPSLALLLNAASALPEIALLIAACTVLIVDLFVPEARRKISFWLTQLGLLVTAWLTLYVFHGTPVHAFNNTFVADAFGDLLKFLCCLIVIVTLFYSRTYLAARGLFRGETFVLIMFALLGMMVMISANHLLTLYLGLELMSLALYAMIALQRDSKVAIEASMKYFVLGALASGLLLYGMSMVYGATGSLELGRIAAAVFNGQANRIILAFGLVFVVSAIAFKLGAVPYHMWLPDVYEGAPTAFTLFIGTGPKLAAFAFMMRLLVGALAGLAFDWQGMLLVLSVLSMVLGSIVAIAQTSMKRMLAYSTIANMGFMLLGFLTADLNGFSAAMFYMIIYVLTTLVGFGIVMLLARSGFEADKLDDFRGLNQRSPWYAFLMLLVMFSLAGLPPTVGFYAKFAVFEAAIDVGLVWFVVIAVLCSLIGAFYYLRVVKLMYFDDPVDRSPIEARGDTRILLSLNGIAILFFGIFPQQLMGVCVVALARSF
ncbi:MAG: NADH-quinone oxidoreductase subunit NuoN [Casimicrobiaceae bacterium]